MFVGHLLEGEGEVEWRTRGEEKGVYEIRIEGTRRR